MKNKELQQLLSQHPDDVPVRLMLDHRSQKIIEFTDENVLLTSETAFVNTEAPEEEWNHEDGRIDLGEGQRFLLINPIIL